jgi:hypothetical protein
MDFAGTPEEKKIGPIDKDGLKNWLPAARPTVGCHMVAPKPDIGKK